MVTRVRIDATGGTLDCVSESLHNASDYVLDEGGIFPGRVDADRREILEEVYERMSVDEANAAGYDRYAFKGRVVVRIAKQ